MLNILKIILYIALLTPCIVNANAITSDHKRSLPCVGCLYDRSIWAVMRQNFRLPPAYNHPDVKKQIKWFQNHPESLAKTIERSNLYLHFILSVIINNKLPAELAFIPFIESNYNPFAHSSKGAAGLWQISPSTASGYKLEIDWWKDDKRDVVYSTYKAISYLSYLNRYFKGDWELAISAYNAGEGRIKKAVKQQRINSYSKKRVWELNLAKETKDYLPKILALQAIISNPQKYKVNLPFIKNKPFFSIINITKPLSFPQISQSCDVDENTLRLLNPSWRRIITLTDDKNYNLIVPYEKENQCIKALKKIEPLKNNTWPQHTVTNGQTLDYIANKYKTTAKNIAFANGIDNNKIYVNQVLFIPKNITREINIAPNKLLSKDIAADGFPGPKQTIHTILKGDTLQSIASKYNTKVSKLIYWNHLSTKAKLTPGDKVTIWTAIKRKNKSYTIKRGDTLSSIARAFNTKINTLKRINNMSGDLLRINQSILIP